MKCACSEPLLNRNRDEIFGIEYRIGHENNMVPDRACSNYPCLGRQRGSTVFELTVVIALFLVLVGVMFLGFQTWRIEANQATCITNISSIQKAVESYQNAAALPAPEVPALSALSAERLSALNARLSAMDAEALSRMNADIKAYLKTLPALPTLNADRMKEAWIAGADITACVVNMSALQKAMRGYQHINSLVIGDPLTIDDLTKAGYWTSVPTCPAGGAYSFLDKVPAVGVAYATCRNPGHAPSQAALDNW